MRMKRGEFFLGEREFMNFSRPHLANIRTKCYIQFHETYLENPTCARGIKYSARGLSSQQRVCVCVCACVCFTRALSHEKSIG